jgi:aarF domain-containing kinase
VLRERRVPATPIGRALGFAGMGASLLLGTLKDNIVGTFTGPPKAAEADASSASSGGGGGAFHIITESNAERLAAALCRMRGAALKLGQMLSIQDDTVLPPQVGAAEWGGVRWGAASPGRACS